MRKLFFGLACAVISYSAMAATAQWLWSTGFMNGVYTPGSQTTLNGSTAYLFLSSSASTVLANWTKGTAISGMSGILDSKTVSSGSIAQGTTAIEYDVDPLSAVFVTEYKSGDSKYLYISSVVSKEASDQGAATLVFNEKTSSQAAAFAAGTAYGSAGWYTAESVPEPFSGALALVGLGVIGLRRKLKGKKQEKKA